MDTPRSLVQEFYGCLVLLRLLTPNRSRVSPGESIDHSAPKRNKWHKFLDNLAWLADHKCGGKTVTAIAVEPTATGPKYWIACNSPIRPEAVQHIEKVLSDLDQEASSDKPSPTSLIRNIAKESINFSWIRVQDYSRRLKGLMTAIDSSNPSMTLDEIHRQYLDSFLNLSGDPDQLIKLSMTLKRSSLLKRLCELIRLSEDKTMWKEVRHFLGRLCSWVRAAQNLVLTCKRFRNRIKNARVQQINMSSTSMADFQLPWREPSDILREILPDFHESLLQDALHARQNDKMVDKIMLCLSKMVEGKFDPDLHAEIILLLHFHVRRLEFIAGDRYIACSKPSCYCCDLYLRNHPAGILPRRSHGNIWVKWEAPELRGEMVPVEAHVLQNILNYVKSDLRCQILSGPNQARRPPDSTTGLGTTEPSHDLV